MADDAIGEAKVRITPDTTGFADELKAQVDAATADQGKNVDVKVGVDDADATANLGDFDRRLDEVGAKNPTPRIGLDNGDFDAKVDADKAKLDELDARHVDPKIGTSSSSSDIDSLGSKIDDLGKKFDDLGQHTDNTRSKVDNLGNSAQGAGGALDSLKNHAQTLTGQLGGLNNVTTGSHVLMSTLKDTMLSLIPAFASAAVPIGAVAGAAGLGALPVAAVGAATAMGALKLGLQGVSTSMDAVLAPLKQATPAATAFGQAVGNTLLPGLTQTRNIVQQNMFGPMLDGLHQALPAVGALETGMGQMGTAIGQVAQQFGTMLGSAQHVSDINSLTQTAANTVRSLGSAVSTASGAFLDMGAKVGPLMGSLTGSANNVAGALAHWATGGGFDSFLAYAMTNLPAVKSLLDELGRTFSVLLQSLAPLGQTMLPILTTLVHTIQGPLVAAGQMLSQVFAAVGPTLTSALNTIGPVLSRLIGSLSGPLTSALNMILPAIAQLVSALGPALTTVLGALLPAVGQLVQALGPALGTVIQALVPPLTSLISALGPGLAQVVTALAPILAGLVPDFTVFGSVIQALAPALAQFLGSLTPLLPIVSQLANLLASEFIGVLQAILPAILQLAPGLSQLAGPLIGGLTTVLKAALPVLQQVGDLLAGALGTAFKALAPVIAQLIPPLANVVTSLLTGLLPVIKELTPIIPQLVQTFVTGLLPVIQSLLPVIRDLAPVFEQIVKAVAPLIPPIVQLGIALNPSIQQFRVFVPVLNALMPVITPLLQLIGNLATWLSNLLAPALRVAASAVTDISGFLSGTFHAAFEAAGSVVSWLGGVFQTIWRDVISPVIQFAWSNVIQPAWNGIKQGISDIGGVVNTIGGAFSSAFDAVSSAVGSAWSFISGIFDKIKGAVTDVINTILRIASDALNPLISAYDDFAKAFNASPIPGPTLPIIAPINLQIGGGAPAAAPPTAQETANAHALSGRASGGPVDPRTPYLVGEQGPEVVAPLTAASVIPNNQLGTAAAAAGPTAAGNTANPGAAQVAGWQQTSTQLQTIWQQMQTLYLAHSTEQLTTTQTFGAQQVTANQNVWTQVHTNAQTVWTQMQTQYQATNALNLANTQQYGAQTQAQNLNTWNLVRDQSQATWQQMFAQYTGTNALNLANTQAYGAQTVSTLNNAWTLTRDQSQATWQQMTTNLQAENATQLQNVTESSNAAKEATLTAYQDMATSLPPIVSGMWSQTDNAYKGGINNTVSALDTFLDGVNQVGGQVGWQVSLHINPLAAGGAMNGNAGRYNAPTFLVGEGAASEYVIPTDPAHHANAAQLQTQMYQETGGRLGVPGLAAGGIVNPAPTLHLGRTDQGVDWSGAGPILAVAPGTILSLFNSGWPGGTFIAERLDDASGLPSNIVYYAEDITPSVGIGAHVGAGQQIGAATGGPSGVEIGFGNPGAIGQALAGAIGDFSGDNATPQGQAFLSWIGGGSGSAPGLPVVALPAWNALPAPSTLGGFPPAVANQLAQQVTTFGNQQIAQLQAQSASAGGAGGVSGQGQGGPGSMSPAAIEALWIQEGGPASAAANMAGIALAESGDNPNIVQQGEPPGLTGWGLYQITPTSGIPGGPYLLDPAVNTQKAIQLFTAGGYGPWRGDPFASSHHLAAMGGVMDGTSIRMQTFDTGGLLAPGMTLAVNNTGSSEQVVGPGGGATVTIDQLVVQGGQGTTGEIRMAVSTGISDALSRLEQEYQAT